MAANSGSKRAGARRGARPKRRFRPSVLAYAVAITALVIGWGYLVWAAIDFGSDARDGDSRAWGFLGLAALGAAACLFAGLLLVARLLRALGGTAVAAGPGPERVTAALSRPRAALDTGLPTAADPAQLSVNGSSVNDSSVNDSSVNGGIPNGNSNGAPQATVGDRPHAASATVPPPVSGPSPETSSVVGPGGLPTRNHVRDALSPRARRQPAPSGRSHRHRAG